MVHKLRFWHKAAISFLRWLAQSLNADTDLRKRKGRTQRVAWARTAAFTPLQRCPRRNLRNSSTQSLSNTGAISYAIPHRPSGVEHPSKRSTRWFVDQILPAIG